jgi:hypothetical protein
MYLQPQGINPKIAMDALTARVAALENIIYTLQLDVKPKRGRPPKDNNEAEQRPKSDS